MLLQEPQNKKSIGMMIAFGLYMINVVFFCCRALRPCEKGYAPNDLEYLQEQLQCANPFACIITFLDGIVFIVFILWCVRFFRKHGSVVRSLKKHS